MSDPTEDVLSQAAWMEAAIRIGKIDIPNYDAMAEELGITRHEAMVLGLLSRVATMEYAINGLANFVSDFHRREFPEKWVAE